MLIQREGAETTRLPGIFIGKELAYMVGLIPGDLVTLISPTETQGPLESVPRLRQFVVEGIYQSGTPDQELHTIYSREKDARSFLRKRDVVSQWEVSVHDFDRAPDVAARLRPLLPGFRVQDWVQLNSTLFFSLKLERLAMFVVMVFIVVVASFNIITTLTMMVMEKKREISILKAMGARDAQVGAVFLAEGLLIGGIGVGGGVFFAAIICSILQRFEFVALPDVYYDRTLPVTFVPEYYLIVAFAAFVIVLLAAAYPTRRAVRLHPLEGIRSK
jgi:lipoprotein-releasing system permease protein